MLCLVRCDAEHRQGVGHLYSEMQMVVGYVGMKKADHDQNTKISHVRPVFLALQPTDPCQEMRAAIVLRALRGACRDALAFLDDCRITAR